MGTQSRIFLKSKWVSGYKPTQSDYEEFFDSFYNISDDNIGLPNILSIDNTTNEINISSNNGESTLSLFDSLIDLQKSDGFYTNKLVIDNSNILLSNNNGVDNNYILVNTSDIKLKTIGQIILDSSEIILSNELPNKLTFIDNSNKLTTISLGTGLTISGGTLSVIGGGGGGSQTLFDTLSLGNSTGNISISSPNTNNILQVQDTVLALSWNGVYGGNVTLDDTLSGIFHDTQVLIESQDTIAITSSSTINILSSNINLTGNINSTGNFYIQTGNGAEIQAYNTAVYLSSDQQSLTNLEVNPLMIIMSHNIENKFNSPLNSFYGNIVLDTSLPRYIQSTTGELSIYFGDDNSLLLGNRQGTYSETNLELTDYTVRIQSTDNENNLDSYVIVQQNYVKIGSNVSSNFIGAVYEIDYSANYTNRSLVDKGYVTNLISSTLSNTSITSKLLTGLNITGTSITSTDSILSAFGKLQNQINGLLGGAIYQGTYNASTNTPTLSDATGTNGYYYVVNVSGTQNFGSGSIVFTVGDWVIYNGSIWQKVDNTDSVLSVNGYIGDINLVTGDIPESSNLYFTNARSIGSQLTGYVSATGSITSSDTILTAIQKLNGNMGNITSGVSSFNTRQGSITLLSSDVTTALGYTPYNSSNPSGYIGSSDKATSSDVTIGSDNTKYITSLAASASLVKISPRVSTITSSATPTINISTSDCINITALATNITSMTSGLSGTPGDFQKLIIKIKDNGTARTITWGASYENKGATLPTTTTISKVLIVGLIYDSSTSKWGCVAVNQEA